MGKIFYIIGKSATGKDHIYKELLRDSSLKLRPLVLYTTRPMRENEENGREYYFTDENRLEAVRREGRLIEERVYHTVHGDWYYFTADEGQIRPDEADYLGIGTPESLRGLRRYFGEDCVVPLYIETEDGLRLERALKRERSQENPKYAELCRRFLADCEDFSDEKLREAGISRRFANNGLLDDCIQELRGAIKESRASLA